jgi:predicted RNase H-like nuclease
MTSFGVDGCKGGWIAACSTPTDVAPTFRVFARFDQLVDFVVKNDGLCMVDVPIGLSDAARQCDSEARRILGKRHSSVFTPPSRKALSETSSRGIRRVNLLATGRSLSAQVLGILPKIREVDSVMTPALQARIREVHPEVIFATLHPAGTGLAAGKKTTEGQRARLALLPAPFARAAAAQPCSSSTVAMDDYVDALAALVVAIRCGNGKARHLPAGPEQRDERGLAMEMVY